MSAWFALTAIFPSAASPYGVNSVTAQPASKQAAAHSNFHLNVSFQNGSEKLKDLKVHLPAGLIGNPRAATRCTIEQFEADSCPASSQVGTTTVSVTTVILILPVDLDSPGEVYNLQPRGSEPARLGIILRPVGGLTGTLAIESPVTVRAPGDFGLDSTLSDLPTTFGGNSIEINSIDLTLNGYAGSPSTPFMTNPTSCGLSTTTVEATSYANPNQVVTGRDSFTPTDCGSVPFTPSVSISADPARADYPAGFQSSISFPTANDPLQQAYLKNANIVLPEGVALSPTVASAGNLQGCTDAQLAPDSAAAAACPTASQVGDVTFETPVLGTLHGKVFLGTPTIDHPMRLFIDIEEAGLIVKLVGYVVANPSTGQLTTTFNDLPQVPFTAFTLRFNGGDHAVLSTPPRCGTFTLSSQLTPWSGGSDARPQASFTTSDDGAGAACPSPPPFQPTVTLTPSSRR